MKHPGLWLAFACTCLAASALAQAQDQSDVPEALRAQRDVLSQARQRITLAHEHLAKACWQKFAVNDCLADVRRSQRGQLDPIHHQELMLNAQERAWRMQQRDLRLQNKAQDAGGSDGR